MIPLCGAPPGSLKDECAPAAIARQGFHKQRVIGITPPTRPSCRTAVVFAAMTLTQLKVFVLVTRLGSVKAAATTLGVSEPAVSQALAALRQHLGDPLIVRTGTTMELTPAGQRIVGMASQMVSLAIDAEMAARSSNNAPELLRIVATSTIADAIAPSLLHSFASRVINVEINLGIATAEEMTVLLEERLADVALGSLPAGRSNKLAVQPLLRWRMVVVARSDHRLAARRCQFSDLSNETWLVDPSGLDPHTEVAKLIAQLRIPEERIRVFPNQAAAIAAAVTGEGIAPAVDHLLGDLRATPTLVRLAVDGTPRDSLWHASTLAADRRTSMAGRFARFLSTPDALHEMHHLGLGVSATRFKPPIYVTIWS